MKLQSECVKAEITILCKQRAQLNYLEIASENKISTNHDYVGF